MPKDRKFVNPLTQPSTSTATSTDTTTFTSTLPSTDTSTSTRRKRGKEAFEQTHERITLWLKKDLKARFEALAEDEGIAKSALLDEAIADVLKKHQR